MPEARERAFWAHWLADVRASVCEGEGEEG